MISNRLRLDRLRPLLACAAVMSVYYSLYVLGFSESDANYGPWVNLLKFASIAVVTVLMFRPPKLPPDFSRPQLVILFLVGTGLAILALKAGMIGNADLKFVNIAACAAPFLVLQLRRPESLVDRMFRALTAVVAVQISIDAVIFFADLSLWGNKAFIGGTGNPSSFGFVGNLCLTYLLYRGRETPLRLLLLAVLTAGVVMTSSLMAVGFLGLNFLVFSWSRGLFQGLVLSALVASGLVYAYNTLLVGHLEFKVRSLLALLSGSLTGGESMSVLYRVTIYRDFVDQIRHDPLQVLVFGYPDYAYYFVDSQVLTFLGSFGLLWTAGFAGLVAATLFRAVRLRSLFWTVVLSQFIGFFLVNRILDYFPIPIFFFFAVAAIWAEAPARSVLRRQDAPVPRPVRPGLATARGAA